MLRRVFAPCSIAVYWLWTMCRVRYSTHHPPGTSLHLHQQYGHATQWKHEAPLPAPAAARSLVDFRSRTAIAASFLSSAHMTWRYAHICLRTRSSCCQRRSGSGSIARRRDRQSRTLRTPTGASANLAAGTRPLSRTDARSRAAWSGARGMHAHRHAQGNASQLQCMRHRSQGSCGCIPAWICSYPVRQSRTCCPVAD